MVTALGRAVRIEINCTSPVVIGFDQYCLPIDLHHGGWGVVVLFAITHTAALIFWRTLSCPCVSRQESRTSFSRQGKLRQTTIARASMRP